MSTAATENQTGLGAHDEVAEELHAGHPSDWMYIKVAIFLAVITAIEVGLYYVSFARTLNNLTLIALSLVKFVAVVGYFMHLKYDNRILRWLFVTGLALAAFVYPIVFLTFGLFIS